MDQRISVITLGVADLRRAMGFYAALGWGGISLGHVVRSRAEVDTVLAAAEAAGGTVARPAGEMFWGGYSGVFHDPDGHAWEVAHNPSWTLAEDGSVALAAP